MKEIDKILDITPSNTSLVLSNESPKNSPNIYDIESDPNFNADFAVTRKELIRNLEIAKDASQKMSVIAKESEKSRDYEVLNNILKTVNETTKSIIEIYDRKINQERNGKIDAENNNTTYVQNAVFVGTTTDLKKIIRDMDKEEKKKEE